MPNIIVKLEPIETILEHSVFEVPYLKQEFKRAMLDLWSFEIFKPMLDLCATKCLQKTLGFKISNKRFFELDEGNCKTITTPLGGFFNKFKARKNFEISIKKVDTSVIIHEIAHMVEQACELEIIEEFSTIMAHEIHAVIGSKSMAKNAVESVLVKELKAYPKQKIPSELFARIYQLLAQSKEIYGFAASFAFSYQSISQSFAGTIKWLKRNVDPRINNMNMQEVVQASEKYIKLQKEQDKQKWTGKRVKSFHKKKESGANKKWSSNVSSIKDDPFK